MSNSNANVKFVIYAWSYPTRTSVAMTSVSDQLHSTGVTIHIPDVNINHTMSVNTKQD